MEANGDYELHRKEIIMPQTDEALAFKAEMSKTLDVSPSGMAPLTDEEITNKQKLDDLAVFLLKSRDEAVTYRETSGIEDVWKLCEDRYHGIDDANRHEYLQLKLIKPTVMNAPLTTGSNVRNTTDIKSTVFVRLTSRYVDAACAKVSEILLGEQSFSFKPTPVQEFEDGKHDQTPVVENGQPLMRPAKPEDVPPPMPGEAIPAGGTPAPTQVPVTTKDLVSEQYAIAYKSAKKAERRVYDWHVECKYNKQMRKVIRDSARLGVGVLKGPYPEKVFKKKLLNGELKTLDKTVPVVSWRDPWNIYPDPSCGDSIREGDYLWERDYLSPRRVRKMKELPGYIKKNIDLIIEQGPGKKIGRATNPSDNSEERSKRQFEVWYFTGTIDRSQYLVANPNGVKFLKESQDTVYVVVTVINDVVVKASINPLASGELNYHSVPWLPRGTFWAGVGPNEQMSAPQKICNGAVRAMLNNAGVSSGGQIVIDAEAVVPANGDWAILPNKIWYKSSEGVVDDVRKAFTTFEIPNHVNELMKVIEFAMKLGEESTNIPLVTQGQSGATTPETLGAVQLQDNNANQLLRDVGYTYDDHITEPVVGQFYEWLLLDPDVPDDEKDEWAIDARGSSAKVERAIQDVTLAQVLPLSDNPSYGIDPKKAFALFMRAKHIDPSEVQYSEEEMQKIQSQPKPPEPGIQIAQIKAQIADKQIAAQAQQAQADAQLTTQMAQLDRENKQALETLRNETQRLKVKLDTDRDTVYVETQRAKAQADYQHAIKKLELERELALMDYASQHQITLEQVKGKLADTAMKLRTQKEISAAGFAVDVHNTTTKAHVAGKSMKSAVEIPGRAPKGQGFQK